MTITTSQLRANGRNPDGSFSAPAKARAKRGSIKAARVAKMREDDAKFVSSLPGRWLTRWRAHGGPEPIREHRFHETRKWRFDFCWWPDAKIAVEVDGGTFIRGSHSRGKGQSRDSEKLNAAAVDGWSVLRFTTDMVDDELGFAEAVIFVNKELQKKRDVP